MGDQRIYNPDSTTREADVRLLTEEPVEPFRAVLVVTSADATQVVHFGAQRVLTVGRSEPADIRLLDASLSRLHARFSREEDAVRVTDLDSRNGTWVFGKRVKDAVLRQGECAVIGGVTVSVQVEPSAGAAMLGLHSYDTMLQRIEEEWRRAQAFHRTLALVVVKPLRKGEVAAADFAAGCVAELRPVDRAGLYDRDCLLILLPEANADTALGVARTMCRSVRGRGQLVCAVATYPESGSTPEQLVSAAWAAAREASAERPAVLAPMAPHVRDSQVESVVRRSPAMLELQRMIERIAPRPIPVLVTGETGTGKEWVAHEVHARSARHAAAFKVVNCAAIPENLIESVLFGHVKGAFTGADRDHAGVFEQASGGTVFLDEVGELSADAQAALLRVLDTHRAVRVGGSVDLSVDVRVVAATHRDLLAMSEQGSFRLDLYHRLNGIELALPPLRERSDEIEPLCSHFLARIAQAWGGAAPSISGDALECLQGYGWPGNVRELRNVIERAVALVDGCVITCEELPAHIRGSRVRETQRPAAMEPSAADSSLAGLPSAGLDLRTSLQDHEAKLITEALRASDGNQRKAAALLNLPLRTFERKLQQLGSRLPKSE